MLFHPLYTLCINSFASTISSPTSSPSPFHTFFLFLFFLSSLASKLFFLNSSHKKSVQFQPSFTKIYTCSFSKKYFLSKLRFNHFLKNPNNINNKKEEEGVFLLLSQGFSTTHVSQTYTIIFLNLLNSFLLAYKCTILFEFSKNIIRSFRNNIYF